MIGKYFLAGLMFSSFIVSCNNDKNKKEAVIVRDSTRFGKFEPADGKVILFVGQELEAIGGMDKYNDGYFDHFPAAGGITEYTDFIPLKDAYGIRNVHSGLRGLTDMSDWGDGPENISVTITAPALKNSCLAIGLAISNGNDSATATGSNDELIYRLAQWIKDLGNRPVFLRIGYEFNGYDWNHYRKEFYVPAWKRIKEKFDSIGVNNVAYVWQSKGIGTTRKELDDFYPGDDYVDWVAYSYFIPADSIHPMIQFARDHKKPLFIAESSTVFLDANGICEPLDLTKQADAERAWKDWFLPYFRTIAANSDVIKAIHYINAPWKMRPLWKDNPYFKYVDARITKNDSLKTWWLKETSQDKYLKASDSLFAYLWHQ
jgi:hypothetical protein